MLPVEETRLTRDALRYGFAVGKVRVLETRMLDRAAYERLLDAPTFAEQRRLLSEGVYGRYLESAQTAEDVERGLAEALDSFYGYIDEAALPHEVVTFFRTRYDFANLKAALKARLLDAPLEGLLVTHGTIPVDSFRGDLTDLAAPLGPLAVELADETETAVIDARTDGAMFGELNRLAKKSKSAFLKRISQLMVDMGNVKIMVRGAHAGLSHERIADLFTPGGSIPVKELTALLDVSPSELGMALKRFDAGVHLGATDLSDPQTLDVAVDAVLVDALRSGRRGPTGPEPVIAYVFARENEVAGLRVLLLGRLTGIPNDTLRARLRASYR